LICAEPIIETPVLAKKIAFLGKLERLLGERKIDVVIEKHNDVRPHRQNRTRARNQIMNNTDHLALQQARDTCLTHRQALREALDDLQLRDLKNADLESLTKEDRRLLDQFSYRYTRLQDDMGARLMPTALKALGKRRLNPFVVSVSRSHPSIHRATRGTRGEREMYRTIVLDLISASLGEEVAVMPALDRLDRLEQLGWLPSAQEWVELRRTRNEFTHDYPETIQERFERLQLEIIATKRVIAIQEAMNQKIDQRFPEIKG
jgi:hypothetical protein